MSRKRKSKDQKPKEKTYKIKVPVYTTSMLDQSVGLFEDVTYEDMIRFVKDKIAKYTFPLASPTRNKTLMTVIKNVIAEEVLLGNEKALLIQVSAYDTNFYDGYFEGKEKIAITKDNKIGKESNFILLVPRKKGLTAESYTCFFLMFVYEDPTKLNGAVSKLAKLVAKEIIQVPVENIKLPIIMQELKDCKTIPELQIRYTTVYEADNDVDVKYVQYLQGSKLEKKKVRHFKDMPFDVMGELLKDKTDDEDYQTKKTSIIVGKTEYRIKSLIDEAKDELQETAEKIFNFTIGITQTELDTKIHDKDFIIDKLQDVLNNYLSYEQ
ncbi:hypothetical protein [Prevotella sp. ne3005]|uniref:hypothetical protein n=1 Tax=Prevotella sp. ne3005 TaxID=1761887 RepID=UPI000B86B263|nr:hypothetical protein [Prevotella sp. ne3005]